MRVRTPFALAAAVLALAPAAADAASKPRPNLVVASVSNPGGPLTIETVAIANTGARNAGASTARLFLSADRRRGSDRGLPAKIVLPSIKVAERKAGSVLVVAPAGTKPGFYFVIACADNLREVTESHEDDNCRASSKPMFVDPPAPGANQPPAALLEFKSDCVSDFSSADNAPCAGAAYSFRATGSGDPEGRLTRWRLDFGDGGSAAGSFKTAPPDSVAHGYGWGRGDFTVTLTVTDDAGATATDTATVHVGHRPIAVLEMENWCLAPNFTNASTAPCSARKWHFRSKSSQGTDREITEIKIDFGDGTSTTLPSGGPHNGGRFPDVKHTYPVDGSYIVTLTATDSDGLTSTDTATVTGTAQPDPPWPPAPPVAVIEWANVNCLAGSWSSTDQTDCNDVNWAFRGSASYDDDDAIVSWSIDFGDGTSTGTISGDPANSPSGVSHDYSSHAGPIEVTLTVTDQAGVSSSDTIRINNRP